MGRRLYLPNFSTSGDDKVRSCTAAGCRRAVLAPRVQETRRSREGKPLRDPQETGGASRSEGALPGAAFPSTSPGLQTRSASKSKRSSEKSRRNVRGRVGVQPWTFPAARGGNIHGSSAIRLPNAPRAEPRCAPLALGLQPQSVRTRPSPAQHALSKGSSVERTLSLLLPRRPRVA